MGKSNTTESELEQAMSAVATKIRTAARIMARQAGVREVTPEQVVRAALGVHTLNTVAYDVLTAAEVAEEARLSEYQVNDAAREYVRTGGREGLGPFMMFGRRRRFPRASVEAWKASRTVRPGKGPDGNGRAA